MTTEQIIKKLEDCELNPCVEEDREVANYAIKCIKACEDYYRQFLNPIRSVKNGINEI